jgi:hypothetical protein
VVGCWLGIADEAIFIVIRMNELHFETIDMTEECDDETL